MKKTIYFLFLLLLCSSMASAALSLDKTSLEFTVEQNAEQCELITVGSSDYLGEIAVRDVWAPAFDTDTNLNSYIYTAADKGLAISYIDNIADFENQITLEICLSGATPGDYRGALIFTPEAENNTIVEVGTWLFVHVNGEVVTTQDTTSPNSGGGSGGGSRRNTPSNSTNSTTNEFENLGRNPGISNDESSNELETSETMNGSDESSNKLIYLIIAAIAVVIVLIAIRFRK